MLVCHRSDRKLFLHPLSSGGSQPRSEIRIIDESRNGSAQRIRIFGLDQQACFPMCNCLDNTACRKSNDRQSSSGGFQGRDAQSLGQCRMGKQIKAGNRRIEILTKSRELHDVSESKRRCLRTQLVVEITLAKNYDPQLRIAILEIRDSLQQILMTLARDKLPGGGDNEVLQSQSELGAHLRTVWSSGKSINIDSAANNLKARVFDTPVAEHVGNRFRDRDDFAEGPVAQTGDEPHLRIIDPARNNRRNVGEARSEPSEDICPAATVTMHDIRSLVLKKLREPIAKGQIKIAGAKKILHTNFRLACHGINPGVRRTDKDVVMATLA